MLKKIILTTISFLLPMLALADELTLKENAPKTYVVKKRGYALGYFRLISE